MSKADNLPEKKCVLPEEKSDEMATGTTSQASEANDNATKDPLPPPPPPPPPPLTEILKCETNESIHLSSSRSSIPKDIGFGRSFPSSLASSFVSYASDVDDINIFDLELVDDETSLGFSLDDSKGIPRCVLGEADAHDLALSHLKPPSKNTSVGEKADDDSFLHGHNAHHQRADFSPTPPMRGNSVYSVDPETLIRQPYVFLHQTQPDQDSYNQHSSFNSSIPSMWEDSWATYGTALDHNNHHVVDIMREVVEEGKQSLTMPIFPNTKNNSAFANPNNASGFQRMPKRIPSAGRNQSPKRSSSRTSQYSGFSNMSRSTLDPTAMRRVSRNERISRLKRKSIAHASQSSSPLSTLSKSIHSIDSYQSQNHDNFNMNTNIQSERSLPSVDSSNSKNSAIPQRRSTKILPLDEEAEAEPTSFLAHSESQLSLTSSEEEDSDFEPDHTPHIPGRRISASSLSLYDAETAVVCLDKVFDTPLSAPLRRTSTFGSTTLDPATVIECQDEESDLEAQKRPFPVSSIHMPKDCWDNAPPVTSIHVPPADEGGHGGSDAVPTLPFRQRSIGERQIRAGRIQKDRQRSEAASARAPPNQRSPPSAAEDSMPLMPKRQSTITSVETRRTLRHETDDAGEGNETTENDSESASASSPASSLHSNRLASQQKESEGITNDAPRRIVSRQMSFSSRCLHTMDVPALPNDSAAPKLGGQPIPVRGSEEHENDSRTSDRDRGSCSACFWLLNDSHPPQLGGSVASNATTLKVSGNNQREPERRMPPDRHYTQGSSLRSAAASLQKRDVGTSAVSKQNPSSLQLGACAEERKKKLEDNSLPAGSNQKHANCSSEDSASGSDEVCYASHNKDTLQASTEKLGCLDLYSSCGEVNAPDISSFNLTPTSDGRTSAVASTYGGDGDCQSIGSLWTSVSKEFEALKSMHKDTMAGLESQLKVLERDHLGLYHQESTGDLSRSSEKTFNTEGGSGLIE